MLLVIPIILPTNIPRSTQEQHIVDDFLVTDSREQRQVLILNCSTRSVPANTCATLWEKRKTWLQ